MKDSNTPVFVGAVLGAVLAAGVIFTKQKLEVDKEESLAFERFQSELTHVQAKRGYLRCVQNLDWSLPAEQTQQSLNHCWIAQQVIDAWQEKRK